MKARWENKRLLVKALLIIFLVTSIFLFLRSRKDALLKDCSGVLASVLSRGTHLQVKIGGIEGHLLGGMRFRNVEVSDPSFGSDAPVLFKAKEVEFRYRFLDFISKNFTSKIEVIVNEPVLWLRPSLSARKPDFPFLVWMRDWALSQRQNLAVHVKKMTLVFGYEQRRIQGIDVDFENNDFRLVLPLSHLNFGEMDVTSTLNAEGQFELGLPNESDKLTGKIKTEGTVINWKPLPGESEFDFVFSRDGLYISSSYFLGGIELAGRISFTKDYEMEVWIRTVNYPLSNLGPFISSDAGGDIPGRVDLETHFSGSPWAPFMESRARIYEGLFEEKDIKAMEVNFDGVYPTVRLADSRILLHDGSVMRLAERTLEVKDLLKEKTYDSLVASAEQDTVVWGDWEFSRPMDIRDQPEFLMQRNMGDKASVHFRRFNEYGDEFLRRDTHPVEVGLQYKLRSQDTLKLQLREDEEFLGVERKLRF